MKITPAKNYKKPLYAIGLTTAVMAMAITGCHKPEPDKPVELDGDVQIATTETSETETEVILDGEVEVCPDDKEDKKDYDDPDVDYAGGLEMYTEETK